jgi:hypothetical protein
MRTTFRRGHDWAHWRPSPAVLTALLDLFDTWREEASWTVEVTRPERKDTAENAEEARELIASDAVIAAATGITVHIFNRRESGSAEPPVGSVHLDWRTGDHARVFVSGSDEIRVDLFHQSLVAALEPGVEHPSAVAAAEAELSGPLATLEARLLAATERSTLDLARVRFVGTYRDLCKLIAEAAEQLRQVTGSVDDVEIGLSEHPAHTITVRRLEDLDTIADRDVGKFRHLSVRLTHRASDGSFATLALYFARPHSATSRMYGYVSGSEPAQLRTLRASTNDLLRSSYRSAFISVVLTFSGVILATAWSLFQVLAGWVPPLGVNLTILTTTSALCLNQMYLPGVELLRPDEKPRWSRWSKFIILLVLVPIVVDLISSHIE